MGDIFQLVQKDDRVKTGLAVALAAWAAYSQAYPHTIFGQVGTYVALPLGVLFGIRSGGVSATQPNK